MANENQEKPAHDDNALAALHGLGGAQEPEAEEGHEETEHEEVNSSPAASGFVGMLAKGNPPSDEPATNGVRAGYPQQNRPTPKPMNDAGQPLSGANVRPTRTDEIRMAKEIIMPAKEGPAAEAGEAGGAVAAPAVAVKKGTRGRKVPAWYPIAVPVMFTMCSILTMISFWALGAVIYMMTAHPDAVSRYPLISWDEYLGDNGGFTTGSKLMAGVMLVCLPVGIILAVMAIIMQRQVRKADLAKEAKAAAVAAKEEAAAKE